MKPKCPPDLPLAGPVQAVLARELLESPDRRNLILRYLFGVFFSLSFGTTAAIVGEEVTSSQASGQVFGVFWALLYMSSILTNRIYTTGMVLGTFLAVLVATVQVSPLMLIVFTVSSPLVLSIPVIATHYLVPFVLHVLQQILIALAMAMSFWVEEVRVYLVLIVVAALGLWHPAVVGGCPLTLAEDELRDDDKMGAWETRIIELIRMSAFPRRQRGVAVVVAIVFIVVWEFWL